MANIPSNKDLKPLDYYNLSRLIESEFARRSGLFVQSGQTSSGRYGVNTSMNPNYPLRTILTMNPDEFYISEFVDSNYNYVAPSSNKSVTVEDAEHFISLLLEICDIEGVATIPTVTENNVTTYNTINSTLVQPKVAGIIPQLFSYNSLKSVLNKLTNESVTNTDSSKKSCRAACTGLCLSACGADCTSTCGRDCTTGCSGDCTSTCTGTCTSSCAVGCEVNCTGACTNSCTNSCINACDNTCNDACVDNCTGACVNSCTNQCRESCSVNCLSDCTNTCKSACANGCYTTCTSLCQGGCKSECGNSCSDTCAQTCGTACGWECSHRCTGTCGNSCISGCGKACGATCTTMCINGCSTTCQGSSDASQTQDNTFVWPDERDE